VEWRTARSKNTPGANLGRLRQRRRGAVPPRRKARGDKANLIVAKAAKIAGESMIRELIPERLAPTKRHFEEPR